MKPLLTTVFMVLLCCEAMCCSMFKITSHGKTMIGNNEDSWRPGASIWFETARWGGMGAAYLGNADGFPQGGINEAGLSYDGFTVHPLARKEGVYKKTVTDESDFLKGIMQHCRNIEEVVEYASLYDRRRMNNGVYLFVDSTGNYLVMEADTLITGDQEKYIQSNFCPSVTTPAMVKLGRYTRGQRYLAGGSDSSLRYAAGMMNAMHECRRKLGDGTMYTNIYDLNNQEIYLYFYHDYQHVVHFNLAQELKKGDHRLAMSTLFPENKEYKRFLAFQTPFNNGMLQLGLWGIAFLLAASMVYWLVNFKRNTWVVWLGFVVNGGLLYGIYLLLHRQDLFYFDIPAAKLGLIPLFLGGVVVYEGRKKRNFVELANGGLYMVLIVLCLYWNIWA